MSAGRENSDVEGESESSNIVHSRRRVSVRELKEHIRNGSLPPSPPRLPETMIKNGTGRSSLPTSVR